MVERKVFQSAVDWADWKVAWMVHRMVELTVALKE